MLITYTDLDAAREALQAALRDASRDHPDMQEDEFAADVVEYVAFECDAVTAYELCRTELGTVPVGLLRQRPDVAAIERRLPIEF